MSKLGKRIVELEMLLLQNRMEYLNFIKCMYEKGLITPTEYSINSSFDKEKEKIKYSIPVNDLIE
jgi:hypothetical protein